MNGMKHLVAGVAIGLLRGGGTASAAHLIHTSGIAKGAVTLNRLAPGVQKKLNKHATNGLNGVNGANGLTGAPGLVGAAGPQGMAGPQGTAGPQGAVGAPGPRALRACRVSPVSWAHSASRDRRATWAIRAVTVRTAPMVLLV